MIYFKNICIWGCIGGVRMLYLVISQTKGVAMKLEIESNEIKLERFTGLDILDFFQYGNKPWVKVESDGAICLSTKCYSSFSQADIVSVAKSATVKLEF